MVTSNGKALYRKPILKSAQARCDLFVIGVLPHMDGVRNQKGCALRMDAGS